MRFVFRQRLWARESSVSYSSMDPSVRDPNMPRAPVDLMPKQAVGASASARSLLLCFRRAITVLPGRKDFEE